MDELDPPIMFWLLNKGGAVNELEPPAPIFAAAWPRAANVRWTLLSALLAEFSASR